MYSFENYEVWYDNQNCAWCVIKHVLLGVINTETREITNARSLSRLMDESFATKEEAQNYAARFEAA